MYVVLLHDPVWGDRLLHDVPMPSRQAAERFVERKVKRGWERNDLVIARVCTAACENPVKWEGIYRSDAEAAGEVVEV